MKESTKNLVRLYLRDIENFGENETNLYSIESILTLAVRIYQVNAPLTKKYEGSVPLYCPKALSVRLTRTYSCTTLSVIDIFPKFVYEFIEKKKKEIFAWIKEEIENEDVRYFFALTQSFAH